MPVHSRFYLNVLRWLLLLRVRDLLLLGILVEFCNCCVVLIIKVFIYLLTLDVEVPQMVIFKLRILRMVYMNLIFGLKHGLLRWG